MSQDSNLLIFCVRTTNNLHLIVVTELGSVQSLRHSKWPITPRKKSKTLIKTLEENNIDLLIIELISLGRTMTSTQENSVTITKAGKRKFNNLHNLAETKLQLNNEVYGADKIVSTVETLSSHGNFKVFNQGNISVKKASCSNCKGDS